MLWEEDTSTGSERLTWSPDRQSQGRILNDTEKRTVRVTPFDSLLVVLARKRKWLQRTCLLPRLNNNNKKNLLTPCVCPRGACPGADLRDSD